MDKATLAEFQPLPDGVSQYPLEYIEGNAAIKLADGPDGTSVGVCNPADATLLESLRQFHHGQVTFFELDRGELTGYLGGLLAHEGEAAAADAAAPPEQLALDKLANDAPVINLVNSILSEAIRREASDIHIEAFADRVAVRYRLDGILQTVREVERERFSAVATRIKIMANLNIMERRRPQDGRITVHLGDDSVDLRVSVIPIANGESFVLRVFSRKRAPLTLEQLGLGEGHLEELAGMAARPNGLVLINGPTGSGKTTTLNAVLQRVRSDAKKIITIEDPIEYLVDGVSQIQTNERIGLGFDTLLRRVLRQDPNIIMVGEIRDTQTAELAVRAALTGHLVLSTLHTRDAVSVITRLKNMGIEPYLIAAVLRGAVAQRLARRLCPACRRQRAATPAEAALLARHDQPPGPVYEPTGCKACHQTGFRGRIGIFELFTCDGEIEEMIVAGKRDADIRRHLAARGMKPLLADGFAKVLQGVTTLPELERAVAG